MKEKFVNEYDGERPGYHWHWVDTAAITGVPDPMRGYHRRPGAGRDPMRMGFVRQVVSEVDRSNTKLSEQGRKGAYALRIDDAGNRLW